MNQEMTSMERVMAALHKGEVDHMPIISTSTCVNTDCMERSKAFLPEAHYVTSKIVALAETSYTLLGFDSISPYYSAHLEAAALGCNIDWGNAYSVPYVTQCPVSDITQFEVPATFTPRPPCTSYLKAIKELKKRYGNQVPIIGKVIGPWCLGYHLYGIGNLTMDIVLQPKKLADFLSQLNDCAIAFAKAQFDAGADIVTWIDHVTMDFFSPQIYKELVLPLHQVSSSRLKSYGPIILSIFGDVYDRFDLLEKSGFPILHLVTTNDIPRARSIIGDKMEIIGSINNPDILVSGTSADIRRSVFLAIDAGARILAPEAAVPFTVSTKNLLELTQAAHHARFK